MMNRDPVVRLSQRRSATIELDSTDDLEPAVTKDVQFEPEKSPPVVEINSNEERIELELAIKRSLDDQQESIIEENDDIPNIVESSSDSDGISNE